MRGTSLRVGALTHPPMLKARVSFWAFVDQKDRNLTAGGTRRARDCSGPIIKKGVNNGPSIITRLCFLLSKGFVSL